MAVESVLVDAGSALAALAALFLAASALSALRATAMDRLMAVLPERPPSPRGPADSIESLLGRIGRAPLPQRFRHRARLEERLRLAGERISADAVIGFKLIVFIAMGILVLVLGWAAHFVAPSFFLCVPLAAVAARVPDFVVARKARRRQRRMAAQAPDFAELLVATTGAGLNPPLAFRRSAEVLDGPLGEELRMTVRGLDLGAAWGVVLEDLAERTGDVSIRRLVRAIGRSQRLGTPVASALHNVAEDLRNERQAHAEELARRAPVKMLFPLVFLILPAFLLLTVGPVLLATLRSLH